MIAGSNSRSDLPTNPQPAFLAHVRIGAKRKGRIDSLIKPTTPNGPWNGKRCWPRTSSAPQHGCDNTASCCACKTPPSWISTGKASKASGPCPTKPNAACTCTRPMPSRPNANRWASPTLGCGHAHPRRTMAREPGRGSEAYERIGEMAQSLTDTRLVCVGDREADIVEMMRRARDLGHPADWLI